MNTFYIETFELTTTNTEPTISTIFWETLSDKILTESKLRKDGIDPDYIFSGAVTRYQVTAVAPQPGEVSAFNRLEIGVKVVLENTKNPFYNGFVENRPLFVLL